MDLQSVPLVHLGTRPACFSVNRVQSVSNMKRILTQVKNRPDTWRKMVDGKLHWFHGSYTEALHQYHQLMAGVRQEPQKLITLKDAVDRWLAAKATAHLLGDITDSTLHFYEQTSGYVIELAGKSTPVQSINTERCIELMGLAAMRWKSATKRNHFRVVLLQILAYSRDVLGATINISRSHVRGARSQPSMSSKGEWSTDLLKRLTGACTDAEKVWVHLALTAGFLPHDIGALKWSDIDEGWVDFQRRKTVNRQTRPRRFPLWPETQRLLEQLPKRADLVFHTARGHPVWRPEKNYVTNRFSQIRRNAELPKGLPFSSLRTMCISTARSISVDTDAVYYLVGHSGRDVSERFYRHHSGYAHRVQELVNELWITFFQS